MAFRDIKKYRSVGRDDPHEVLARNTTPAEASLGLAPEGGVFATRIGHNVPQWWDGDTFHARYELVDDPGAAGEQLEELDAAAAPLRLVHNAILPPDLSVAESSSAEGAGVVDLTKRLEQLAESSADPNTRAAVRETLDSLDELEGAVRQLIHEAAERLEIVPTLETNVATIKAAISDMDTENRELRSELEELRSQLGLVKGAALDGVGDSMVYRLEQLERRVGSLERAVDRP